MTSDEFLAKICELGIGWSTRVEPDRKRTFSRHWESRYPSKDKKTGKTVLPTLDDHLYLEWRTGGQSGGSCWDDGKDDPHYPVTGEKEPEFEQLDKLLAELCPGITFLQYKTLAADTMKYDERTENEYYGNYTNYGIKTIRLGDLYEKLLALKLIES
jgi:hypothetical protein